MDVLEHGGVVMSTANEPPVIPAPGEGGINYVGARDEADVLEATLPLPEDDSAGLGTGTVEPTYKSLGVTKS